MNAPAGCGRKRLGPGNLGQSLMRTVSLWLAAAVCAGCADNGPPESSLQRARKQGVVRLGFANEAPFAYRDPSSGELTGEAPAVAGVIMKALGVRKVEGVLTEFGSLIPGLKAGRFDVIAAGMYITPERCKQVLFSEPSYCVREALVVARGNPRALHGYPDVVRTGAKLGVVAGTVELGYARAAGMQEQNVSVFPDGPSAIEGLRSGRVDAFAATSLTASDLLRKLDDAALELAQPFEQPQREGKAVLGCGAFAFRKGDEAWRDAFDRELATFIGSESHAKLVAEFGFGEPTRVEGTTRSALCAGAGG
jgi:polar amino acid transport system substrate-binding protein